MIGYVFTNGHTKYADHVEGLILSKTSVIRPVDWHVKKTLYGIKFLLDPEKFVDSILRDFVSATRLTNSVSIPYAQASEIECAALTVSYLKELLRVGLEGALTIPYYKFSERSNFFFPPPEVLRYSQSRAFNKVIKAMLDDSEQNITFTYGFGFVA